MIDGNLFLWMVANLGFIALFSLVIAFFLKRQLDEIDQELMDSEDEKMEE